MTHRLWMVIAIASLIFAGCAQTAPNLDGKGNGTNNVLNSNAITSDTVSINENAYGNESGNYNSSSDGFKSVYFDFGKYAVTPQMETVIQSNIQVANATGSKIKLEGNCDEFGTDEYNYALGLKRAKAVKDTMVAQGIVSSKMIMVSFGESKPVCTVQSDSCYEKNRRVDMRLVK